MTVKVGDRIQVESEHVGQPTRDGKIVEIIEGALGVRYRVHWEDGHTSIYTPSGGSARIVPERIVPKQKAKR